MISFTYVLQSHTPFHYICVFTFADTTAQLMCSLQQIKCRRAYMDNSLHLKPWYCSKMFCYLGIGHAQHLHKLIVLLEMHLSQSTMKAAGRIFERLASKKMSSELWSFEPWESLVIFTPTQLVNLAEHKLFPTKHTHKHTHILYINTLKSSQMQAKVFVF